MAPRAPSRWRRVAVSAGAVALAGAAIAWVLTQPVMSGLVLPGISLPGAEPTLGPPASGGSGPSLRDITKRAVDEGEVDVYWPGQLSEDWRKKFEAAYQLEFQTSIALKVTASRNTMPANDIATMNRAVQAGQQPAWDAFLGSDAEFAALARDGLLRQREWQPMFGAAREAMLFNGGAVSFAQSILQPAYNSQKAAPASWDALLDPPWKGRLGVASSAGIWATLSGTWGDERTASFVQGLAGQQPALGTASELERRLEDGAIDAIAAQPAELAKGKAAAADVQPLILRSYYAATIVNARHPNAAILFAGFLLTQEGQKLWLQYAGQSSIYVPGSPAQQYVADKQVAKADGGLLLGDWAARETHYAKLLGL